MNVDMSTFLFAETRTASGSFLPCACLELDSKALGVTTLCQIRFFFFWFCQERITGNDAHRLGSNTLTYLTWQYQSQRVGRVANPSGLCWKYSLSAPSELSRFHLDAFVLKTSSGDAPLKVIVSDRDRKDTDFSDGYLFTLQKCLSSQGNACLCPSHSESTNMPLPSQVKPDILYVVRFWKKDFPWTRMPLCSAIWICMHFVITPKPHCYFI